MSPDHDSTSENLDTPVDRNDPRRMLPADVLPEDIAADELERLDAILQIGFRELDTGTKTAPVERVDAIVHELRVLPDHSASRRLRRSVRTLLWISAAFLAVVGTYALISLALRGLES